MTPCYLNHHSSRSWKCNLGNKITDLRNNQVAVTNWSHEESYFGMAFSFSWDALYTHKGCSRTWWLHWRECRQTQVLNSNQASTYGTLANGQTQGRDHYLLLFRMRVSKSAYAHIVEIMCVNVCVSRSQSVCVFAESALGAFAAEGTCVHLVWWHFTCSTVATCPGSLIPADSAPETEHAVTRTAVTQWAQVAKIQHTSENRPSLENRLTIFDEYAWRRNNGATWHQVLLHSKRLVAIII